MKKSKEEWGRESKVGEGDRESEWSRGDRREGCKIVCWKKYIVLVC